MWAWVWPILGYYLKCILYYIVINLISTSNFPDFYDMMDLHRIMVAGFKDVFSSDQSNSTLWICGNWPLYHYFVMMKICGLYCDDSVNWSETKYFWCRPSRRTLKFEPEISVTMKKLCGKVITLNVCEHIFISHT